MPFLNEPLYLHIEQHVVMGHLQLPEINRQCYKYRSIPYRPGLLIRNCYRSFRLFVHFSKPVATTIDEFLQFLDLS